MEQLEIQEEKGYTLRKLQAPDMFIVTTIISKIGIKKFKQCVNADDVKALIPKSKDKDKSSEDIIATVGIGVAFEIVGVILENLEQCQYDVYRLLSRLSGINIEDFETMNGAMLFDMLIDVFTENKKDFMKVASRFLK